MNRLGFRKTRGAYLTTKAYFVWSDISDVTGRPGILPRSVVAQSLRHPDALGRLPQAEGTEGEGGDSSEDCSLDEKTACHTLVD